MDRLNSMRVFLKVVDEGGFAAAARALRSYHRQRNEVAAREAVVQQRFREHVRKVVHEATNPLTVLKSRIGMLAQERADDTPLQDEMSLLNAERILARAYYSPALHQKPTDYPTIGAGDPT